MTTATTEALRLTERINRIEPSATMAVVAEADKLRSQGIDVVDFGAGEPHFSTPQHIKDAAIAAIQGNFTKYTAVAGTAELRDAIAHRHNVDLIPTTGARKSSLRLAASTPCSMHFRFWWITATTSSCRCPIGFRSRTSCVMRAAIAYCCMPTKSRDSA